MIVQHTIHLRQKEEGFPPPSITIYLSNCASITLLFSLYCSPIKKSFQIKKRPNSPKFVSINRNTQKRKAELNKTASLSIFFFLKTHKTHNTNRKTNINKMKKELT